MKILFTAPGFHSNQYYASKTLYVHDVEVHYLLLRKNNCSDYKFIKTRTLKIKQSPKFIRYLLKILKIDTKPANSTYSINSFPSYSNLKKNIKEIKPNLTIIRGRTLYSLMANICCKSLKIKTIRYEQVVLENDKVYLAKGFKNLFKIIKKVQNIILPKILVTPIIKNFDMSFKEMKKRKRYFLPLPIEVNKNIKRTNSKKIRIIMVAKYEPRKNHILFLKAIIKLRKKYEFKIKFIGASGKYDYLSTIKDFVKKNNLEKIVTFKNDIKHKEVLKEYSKHDLFVLPAHSEEFGYSPIEAMSFGLPILVSSDAGCKYTVNPKKRNGFVFKVNNLNDLTKKLEILVSNKKKLREYGNNSLDFIKKYYSTEKYIKQLRKILKEEFDLELK